MANCGMRYAALRERKLRKFLFHCLNSEFGFMVGTEIFIDRLRAFVEAGCFMGNTPDDHRVNGGATPATAVVRTTMGRGEMLAMRVRRRATRECRMTGQCRRRTVWLQVAKRSGDVVRLSILEEGS
jgi:hypothetical protein